MNKKILVGSIIAVVTIVLVSSSSEVDIKYDDNEIEPVDNYIEIVSRIDGFVEDYNWQGGIIIQHLHFDARFKGGLNIKALTLNPFKPFY
ncbi:MAG: hypothetical protein JSW06_03195 [Thermoplasmatales archaeon]|nr:MAG: hypothetical protein JSW06_03195 [Thermoplasmatales archaeon]